MLRNELKIAIRFTILTTVLLGILYPLAVTAFGHFFLRSQSDGGLIVTNGQVTGSPLIGQNFTGNQYFHGRPSAAGNGYDATSSGGSNLASSSKKLVTRIDGDVANYAAENQEPAGTHRPGHRLRLRSRSRHLTRRGDVSSAQRGERPAPAAGDGA